jgi:D-arginine dehydrogenase
MESVMSPSGQCFAEYVVIGAGFAGAATAYHLTRRGARGVHVLEQESVPGMHSSGRNAAFVRQVISDSALAAMAVEGRSFIQAPPSDFPVHVDYNPIGSLLLARGAGWKQLAMDAENARAMGLEVECWSPGRVRKALPLIGQGRFEGAVWCPSDGIVDIHALLSGYLKAAQAQGAIVHYKTTVRRIKVDGGRVTAIETATNVIHAGTVINAGGPWTGPIGVMAGAAPIHFRPCRRHLFVTPPLPWVKSNWPFVLNTSDGVYFRPESGGLMLCACDEDEVAPGDAIVNAAAVEVLAERLRVAYPDFPDVPIARRWAGLRTFTDDGRFVIGRDPLVKGFFWVAGLGGHGVTTSSAVGALAAETLLGAQENEVFSPSRFR